MLPVCGLGSYFDNKEFVLFCSVTEHEHKKINFHVNLSDFNSLSSFAFYYYFCSNMAFNF